MRHFVKATNILEVNTLFEGIIEKGLRATLDTTVFGRTVPFVSDEGKPMLDWNHLSIITHAYCEALFDNLDRQVKEALRTGTSPYITNELQTSILMCIRALVKILVETGSQVELTPKMPITHTVDGLPVFYYITVSTEVLTIRLYTCQSATEHALQWYLADVTQPVERVEFDLLNLIRLTQEGRIFQMENTEQIEVTRVY